MSDKILEVVDRMLEKAEARADKNFDKYLVVLEENVYLKARVEFLEREQRKLAHSPISDIAQDV